LRKWSFSMEKLPWCTVRATNEKWKHVFQSQIDDSWLKGLGKETPMFYSYLRFSTSFLMGHVGLFVHEEKQHYNITRNKLIRLGFFTISFIVDLHCLPSSSSSFYLLTPPPPNYFLVRSFNNNWLKWDLLLIFWFDYLH